MCLLCLSCCIIMNHFTFLLSVLLSFFF
uniref:Uncharacterized protein n=1 Tax=Anguilla anguilla TaxID=7936 RepID=A0A0E9RCQ4_ANGAN